MLMIEWPQFLKNGLSPGEKLSSMTIGVFDGVHLGHQALIEKVVAHNSNGAFADSVPVVITFRQNHKTEETGSLQTFHQKIEMLERLGVKITLMIDFTESFRRMGGIEFLEILLKRGNIGFFAVGSAFHCGYRLDTDAAAIQGFFTSRNVPVETVPEVMEGSIPVSSSRIRCAIAAGDLSTAEKMLGRPYTIDLAAPQDIVLPPPGRYEVILREKQEDQGTKAVILIEGGTVRVPEPFADSRWESAEFLPASVKGLPHLLFGK